MQAEPISQMIYETIDHKHKILPITCVSYSVKCG